MIRHAVLNDASAIAAIYNYYILETVVTFELDAVSQSQISERMAQVKAQNMPWLVLEDDAKNVVGFAYASTWKERIAYQRTAEITVYLHPNASGKAYGTQLYQALFRQLKQTDIHSVIGVVTLPNLASEKLHAKFGMEQVAHFKEVGYKFEQWLDVGYWQGFLNKESK